MQRRYVSSDSDLPDHDLILEMSGGLNGLACHVRHYVRHGVNLVIAGQLNGDMSPIANAASIAREVAAVVVPPGQEFAMVAYVPQTPLSVEPHFHEVTFEVGGRLKRPSSAMFATDKVALPRFRPLDLSAIEAMAGRPVLTFPYGFYTRTLAEATNGQPVDRACAAYEYLRAAAAAPS
jgi:hypothetical protein